jgi:hypothetical protein
MENNFSLTRIKYILLADFTEYRKSLLSTFGLLLGVWIFLLWQTVYPLFNSVPGSTNAVGGLSFMAFWVGGLVTLIVFCRMAGKKMYRSQGLFFTLPANNAEKYAALLIEGLLYFIGFVAVYWLGLLFWKLIVPAMPLPSIERILSSFNGGELATILAMMFISAIFFLAHLSLRKHPLLITFGVILFYNFCFTSALIWIITLFLPEIRQLAFTEEMELFLQHNATWILCVTLGLATLWLLYIAYLKLKERELR